MRSINEWEGEDNYYLYSEDGFTCEIKRQGELGHLCGYVTLPKGHKFNGLHYDEIPVSVHGGLTYANNLENGEWVIGFDCAHSGDLIPSFFNEKIQWKGTYKNIDFVKKEISKLIKQIK